MSPGSESTLLSGCESLSALCNEKVKLHRKENHKERIIQYKNQHVFNLCIYKHSPVPWALVIA